MSERSSRYDILGDRLRSTTDDDVTLTFAEIEGMVGPLPPEALKPQFWANAEGHHDARRRQWLGNGFKAYLNPDRNTVRFVRSPRHATDSRDDQPWTDEELRACIGAYRTLWLAEQRGESLSKSTVRRHTLDVALQGRAKGAYEFRMQNISAVLDDLGLPFVRGYLPRKNVGTLKSRLIAIINDVWARQTTLEEPTAIEEELETRVTAALRKIQAGAKAPPPGSMQVQRVAGSVARFVRDPNVIAWVLNRSDGRCEACGAPAPFTRLEGTPYLEIHHLRPLAEGGPDTVTNALAACPNCHRRLHHGADRRAFRGAILKLMPALIDFPKKERLPSIDD